MVNKSPSFQFYAQDFLTGVMYLTNEEIGIYIKMLAKQWTDGKIPKKRLGFLVGYEWENLSEELKSKFEVEGDFLINTRLENERDKKERFLKKQSENGKLGGRPPKKSKKNNSSKNPNKTQKKPLEDENEIEEEKEVELDKEKGGTGEKIHDAEIWPTFDDFWDEYDKKVGKKESIKKKFNSLNQNTKELIMDYLPRYKQSQPNKQYRKDPSTFLNNDGWEDEIIYRDNAQVQKKTKEQQIIDNANQNIQGWG